MGAMHRTARDVALRAGGRLEEGSPAEERRDRRQAKRAGMTVAAFEASPADEDADGGATGDWIAGATGNKGALHRQLGVPAGDKIPARKLEAAAKKPGKLGRRARLAETLGKLRP